MFPEVGTGTENVHPIHINTGDEKATCYLIAIYSHSLMQYQGKSFLLKL